MGRVMMFRIICGVTAIGFFAAPAAFAQSTFEACQKRFFTAMDCQRSACGSMDVLTLPPSQFCEPTPCKELLHQEGIEATIKWDACMTEHRQAGGKFDQLGQPLPECTANPDYPVAKATADDWLACQQRTWTQCDGAFIDRYLVNGGFDIVKCNTDLKSGDYPTN